MVSIQFEHFLLRHWWHFSAPFRTVFVALYFRTNPPTHWMTWGTFLTSPLGANFGPRGKVVPQGWISSPGGEVIPWGWNSLFAPPFSKQ
jgi:hypothetical protein